LQTTLAENYPSVAVVILSWNGRKYLEKFLPSVCRSTYPNLKIYVADNGSWDDSISFLNEHFPQVHIIINNVNKGFAQGYNKALEKVSADYYVLLNQDVEVTPGWIEPVIAQLKADERIAASQPKILSYHQPQYFEYAGAAGGYMDKFGYTFCRGRIFYTNEEDNGQYNDSQIVFWATGAALFVRAKLYHEAGGLYAEYFAHMEEIDLCWRLQRMGYKIACCSSSIVYHVGGGSLPQGNPRKTYLNFRNNLIMMARNLSPAERRKKIVIRLLLDDLSIFYGFFRRSLADMWAILRAHSHFYGWYRRNKKSLPMEAPLLKDLDGVYTGSVVWEYFVKKKQQFSCLKWKK
jgi:GT2 family glycosyltransferase